MSITGPGIGCAGPLLPLTTAPAALRTESTARRFYEPVTRSFEHLGRVRTMKQLAAETGMDIYTLYQRWHRGDRDERLVRPLRRYARG